MPEAGPRFAIYFAPDPASALWRFGSDVLGYDAATGAVSSPLIPEPLIAEPRRYGFHATIKAPFHLREGQTRESLLDAMADFAPTERPVPLGRLAVTDLTRFVALTSPEADPRLVDFALSVVEAFEPFRAPLSDADRQRRLKSPLTPRQIELLDRFGYPYVAEELQLHMTLAGPIERSELAQTCGALAALYADRVPDGEVLIDRLCLFEQPAPGSRFHIAGTVLLG